MRAAAAEAGADPQDAKLEATRPKATSRAEGGGRLPASRGRPAPPRAAGFPLHDDEAAEPPSTYVRAAGEAAPVVSTGWRRARPAAAEKRAACAR